MNAQNQVKLKSAFQTINDAYRLHGKGCAEYYSSFTPDMWTRAHEDLEHAMRGYNEVLISNRISIFQGTLLSLIQEYRGTKKAQSQYPERIL